MAGLACLIVPNAFAYDKFEIIKSRLDSAAIVRLDLIITIESKIFEEIDTALGRIYFSENGQYYAKINDDIYLFDGTYNWEFSSENNQATKQKLGLTEQPDNRLSFFKDIDKYYKSTAMEPDRKYKLVKLNETNDALLDSLTIFLNKKGSAISRLEYLDMNGDLNKVYITEEEFLNQPDSNLFKIDLPDSVEIISLP